MDLSDVSQIIRNEDDGEYFALKRDDANEEISRAFQVISSERERLPSAVRDAFDVLESEFATWKCESISEPGFRRLVAELIRQELGKALSEVIKGGSAGGPGRNLSAQQIDAITRRITKRLEK